LSLFEISRIKKVFCYPQPFHTFGLNLGYVSAAIFGWDLVVPEGRYSKTAHALWLKTSDSNTLTLGTPTHFKDLIKFVNDTNSKPNSSYSAIIGGANVEKTLWHNLRSTLKIEAPSIGYGATEASPGITHLPPGCEPTEDGDIGWVLPHLMVSIDTNGITFSGESVCSAILQNGTLEFPKSFTLFDRLEKKPDGRLLFRDRNQLIINRGGTKISLEPMERNVFEKLGFEILTCKIPHSRLGEELGILLKCEAGDDFNGKRDSLFLYLSRVYGFDFCSEFCQRTENFPITENAKVDREAAKNIILALNTNN
jgi:acyl-CoA synthetase (AMP-forming)/AMP-acid ligase II